MQECCVHYQYKHTNKLPKDCVNRKMPTFLYFLQKCKKQIFSPPCYCITFMLARICALAHYNGGMDYLEIFVKLN